MNTVGRDRGEEISSLQLKIRSMGQENEGLSRKLQEFSLANRKIADYDNKIALLSQEI